MSYMYGNMYGGMGGMGGGGMPMGGMGGQSTTMMSSALSASLVMSILAAGAFMMMKGSSSTPTDIADTAPVETGTPAPVTSNLDGAKLVTVGGISMNVTGSSCGNGRIGFSESKNDKWIWKLKKAGDWNGLPYYTIESFYKTFSNACSERFLTAPTGCKSPPYLSKAEFGPRQYWILAGDATNGYQIRSLACARNRYENQYLMQSVHNKKDQPFFSSRSGSTFLIENENTA